MTDKEFKEIIRDIKKKRAEHKKKKAEQERLFITESLEKELVENFTKDIDKSILTELFKLGNKNKDK